MALIHPKRSREISLQMMWILVSVLNVILSEKFLDSDVSIKCTNISNAQTAEISKLLYIVTDNLATLNTSGFVNGAYLLLVRSESGIDTFKLIINR